MVASSAPVSVAVATGPTSASAGTRTSNAPPGDSTAKRDGPEHPRALAEPAGVAGRAREDSRLKPPAPGAVPRTRRPPSSRMTDVSTGRGPLGPSGPGVDAEAAVGAIRFRLRRAVAPGSTRTPSPSLSVIVLPRIWAPAAWTRTPAPAAPVIVLPSSSPVPPTWQAAAPDVDAHAVAADRVLRDHLGVVAGGEGEAGVAGPALERVEEDLRLVRGHAHRVARGAHDRVVGDVDVGVRADHDAVAVARSRRSPKPVRPPSAPADPPANSMPVSEPCWTSRSPPSSDAHGGLAAADGEPAELRLRGRR